MRVIFEFDPDLERERELIEKIESFKKHITRWGPDFINPSGKSQILFFLGEIDPRVTVEAEEDT